MQRPHVPIRSHSEGPGGHKFLGAPFDSLQSGRRILTNQSGEWKQDVFTEWYQTVLKRIGDKPRKVYSGQIKEGLGTSIGVERYSVGSWEAAVLMRHL